MNLTSELVISLLNDVSVGIFGVLLSASFCGAGKSRRDRVIISCCILIMLAFHGLIYKAGGTGVGSKLYPLIVHLPTAVVMIILTKKPLWSAISVLCAYLFCEIRRWFALLAVLIFKGGETAQNLAELIITVPLFLFLVRFASPAIRQVMSYPKRVQIQFGAIPAVYYVFDYLTRVYTDLLTSGSPVVLEFMPFVCCVAYLIFLTYNFNEERKKQQILQTQNSLDLRLSQAIGEITRLRDSQDQAARYRHDLRHHLRYISACIDNGENERAKSYISDICNEIEAQRVVRYCENETVNLVLSAFAGRAEKLGVEFTVRGGIPNDVSASDLDLCVLLSNALENALNACAPIAASGEKCAIAVEFRCAEPTGNLFVQITNPVRGEVKFENGLPVSAREGHGIGVRSISAIVERNGGICSFLTESGRFILRLSI